MSSLKFEGKLFNSNEIKKLYHAGTFNIANKSKNSSDGNGLSVSICPNSWIKMARIKSDILWEFYKEDIKMLDYYSLSEDDFKVATIWGVEQGYLIEKELFKIINNSNTEKQSTFNCFEDLKNEIKLNEEYESYEEYDLFREYEDLTINKEIKYIATEKLKKLSLVSIDDSNIIQINLLLFLEFNSDLDGIYYNDKLNIYKDSAPKGIIFNSKINSFSKRQVSLCDNCEDEIAVYEIKGKKLCEKCTNKKYKKDKLNKKTNYFKCNKCGDKYFYGFGKCNCYKNI